MSVIRILPDEVSNRIAAGEVIERPASVVKELLENSIDAGASRVTVRTELGGQRLIQVVDDGCGMDREDALLCIEPHATSKVREAADIERIVTLGFRGEALPSIAAVTRFQLQTRQPDAATGTELRVDGGVLRGVEDCGCAAGTNARARQLFFNLPGRRKFLRSVATEDAHIQEVVLLQAMAHAGLAVELVMDGRQVLQLGAHDGTGARLAALLGRELFRSMLPVDYTEAEIEVRGYVACPGVTRASRAEQRLFVNGRPATADTVFFGIRDAYHTLVMKGRYPPVVLELRLDPRRVDVNVHPAKKEVRFREDRLVGQIVAAAIRRALRETAGGVPVLTSPSPDTTAVPGERSGASILRPASQPQFPLVRPVPGGLGPAGSARVTTGAPTAPVPSLPEPAAPPVAENPPPLARPGDEVAPPAGEAARPGTSPSVSTRPQIRALRVLGCLDELYLIATGPTGLVLIDQHAAHERVLFEKLLAAAKAQDGRQQPLLLSVTVELTPADAALLERNLGHFAHLGFGVEPFGGHTVLVTAVPPHLPQENVAGLLRDILEDLRQSPGGVPRPDDIRIAQAACKHAVKAEDPLTPEEIGKLLEDLAETEMPYTCPHGRPVMISIPLSEVEKRFGRRV